MLHCGNKDCGIPIAVDTDDKGNKLPCPSCGETVRAHGVGLAEEIELSDRLDIGVRDVTGTCLAERASASTRLGDTSSGIDLDTGIHFRDGRQTTRMSIESEERYAAEAIARALSIEDRLHWEPRHVGEGGNLADAELTCGELFEEVQVTWFDTTAIRDLKRTGAIEAANRLGAVGELEALFRAAIERKGATKYPAHDRACLLLAVQTPLPVTPTTVEMCRAAVASLSHGYREVWLVDATSAHRLTVRATARKRLLRSS